MQTQLNFAPSGVMLGVRIEAVIPMLNSLNIPLFRHSEIVEKIDYIASQTWKGYNETIKRNNRKAKMGVRKKIGHG